MRRSIVLVLCALVLAGVAPGAGAATVTIVQTGAPPLYGSAVAGGELWAAYYAIRYDASDNPIIDVGVARQTPGAGCASNGWTCSTVDEFAGAKVNVSQIAIAAGADGSVWLAYFARNAAGVAMLRVAHYVGSGGSGCTSSAWTCEVIERSKAIFYTDMAPAITVGPNGSPVVVYGHGSQAHPEAEMILARRTSGTGCADADWSCSQLDRRHSGFTGFPGVVETEHGMIVASYFLPDGRVRIASGVAGADPSGACGVAYHCFTLAMTDTAAAYPRVTLTVDPQDRVWAAFLGRDDVTGSDFVTVAHPSSNGGGCIAGGWTCERVDAWNNSFALNVASVAFGANGLPYVAYPDASFRVLRVAKRVGSTSCASGTTVGWTCKTIDTDPIGMVGNFPHIARIGTAMVVSYEDNGQQEQLRVATL